MWRGCWHACRLRPLRMPSSGNAKPRAAAICRYITVLKGSTETRGGEASSPLSLGGDAVLCK